MNEEQVNEVLRTSNIIQLSAEFEKLDVQLAAKETELSTAVIKLLGKYPNEEIILSALIEQLPGNFSETDAIYERLLNEIQR